MMTMPGLPKNPPRSASISIPKAHQRLVLTAAVNEDDIARAKARARRRVLAARRALSATDRAAAAASVCRQLAAAPAFARARAVLGFYPLADEIDIRPFLAAVLAAGKILALPRVADSETRAMTIHRVTAAALQNPGRGLAAGFKGIFEAAPVGRRRRSARY